MTKIAIEYQGHKHCRLTHGPSNAVIETDAPKDNNGRGELFSPTDLVAAALGSCMLTVMSIAAERDGIMFEKASAEVVKEMHASPRRISRVSVSLHMPRGLSTENRAKMERTARECPVHRSLHPDVEIPLRFVYPD